MSAQEMIGASVLIRALLDQGVDVVFGYPGGAVLPIYDELFKQNALRHILVRHEQAAVLPTKNRAENRPSLSILSVYVGKCSNVRGLRSSFAHKGALGGVGWRANSAARVPCVIIDDGTGFGAVVTPLVSPKTGPVPPSLTCTLGVALGRTPGVRAPHPAPTEAAARLTAAEPATIHTASTKCQYRART